MPSPDLVGYTDLTLFDRSPSDLVERALLDAAVKMPSWQPRDGNTEVVLMEALALEVSELVYAINRVPSSVVEVLLKLYGVERSLGSPPTASATFTLSNASGYTLPAGTVVRLLLNTDDPVEFTTDADVTVASGATTVTVAITATRNTAAANGTASGSALVMVTAVPYVDSVVLATAVTAGADAEADPDWLDRGIQRLSRLVSTLVLPEHFTAYALEDPLVFRALTIDNFDAASSNEQQTVAISGAPTGGSFTLSYGGQTTAAIAYNATASQVISALEALSSAGAGNVTGTGGPLPGTAVVVTFTSRLGSADVALMTASSSLTGGTTPAVTVTETRKGGSGSKAGFVSVAVAGTNGAKLSAAAKADLAAVMDSRSLANLAVQAIDPAINAVAVTVSVKALPGFTVAQVQANVTAALDAYLSPDTWGWGGTVRHNELIAVIDRADGVDYVQTLTAPSGDVTLTGAAPLADLGATSITVTL